MILTLVLSLFAVNAQAQYVSSFGIPILTLEAGDDLIDPRKDLAAGVYVIQDACSVCPCTSAIDHTADLIPGDKIIGVISNDSSSEIFSQSNLVEIADVKEKQE